MDDGTTNETASGPFGGLSATEAGKRSAELRARREGMSPEDRAMDVIARNAPRLVSELLDAALGRGDFADLKDSDRLKALLRALEYGIGRPTGAAKLEEAPETPTAASLFGGAA